MYRDQSEIQKPQRVVPDCEDYGGIGIEEFTRLITAAAKEDEEKFRELFPDAVWITTSDAGW